MDKVKKEIIRQINRERKTEHDFTTFMKKSEAVMKYVMGVYNSALKQGFNRSQAMNLAVAYFNHVLDGKKRRKE